MGYVFTIAESISWKTELQDTVTLLTTEVKYMAAVEAYKEVLCWRELVDTFGIIHDSVQVYCDVTVKVRYSSLRIMVSQADKAHWYEVSMIRYWVVVENIIDLVKIDTKKNPIDMMATTIPVEKFRASLNFINIL